MANESPIRTHTIALLSAEAIKSAVITAAPFAFSFISPWREAAWIGMTGTGLSGIFILVLVVSLAVFPAKMLARLIAGARPRHPSYGIPHQLRPSEAPPGCCAVITHPRDREMIKAGWVVVEGTYTGSNGRYWLFNNRDNEFWPHVPLELLSNGIWRQEIFLSPEVNPQNVKVVLAWVSPEMHSILESWKNKCRATGNWMGLKMTPPVGHFREIQVLTLQLPGVPEKFAVKLASSWAVFTVRRGQTIEIAYEIEASGPLAHDVWLGASTKDAAGNYFFNKSEDIMVPLEKGKKLYRRALTIPMNATLGKQLLETTLWQGPVGDSSKSKVLSSAPAQRVEIIG